MNRKTGGIINYIEYILLVSAAVLIWYGIKSRADYDPEYANLSFKVRRIYAPIESAVNEAWGNLGNFNFSSMYRDVTTDISLISRGLSEAQLYRQKYQVLLLPAVIQIQ